MGEGESYEVGEGGHCLVIIKQPYYKIISYLRSSMTAPTEAPTSLTILLECEEEGELT